MRADLHQPLRHVSDLTLHYPDVASVGFEDLLFCFAVSLVIFETHGVHPFPLRPAFNRTGLVARIYWETTIRKTTIKACAIVETEDVIRLEHLSRFCVDLSRSEQKIDAITNPGAA